MKIKKTLIVILGLTYYVMSMHSASALQTNYIQINCEPSMQYFSVNGIALDQVYVKSPVNGRQSQKNLIIEYPEDLQKNPYTCKWDVLPEGRPTHSLKAKIVDYREGTITGCVNPTFNVSIELDGIEVRRFNPFIGLCGGEANRFLEVNSFFLRSCDLALHKSGASSCELLSLRELLHSSANTP